MDQNERNKVITQFKKKELPILVATDVAGKRFNCEIREEASCLLHELKKKSRITCNGGCLTFAA